MARQGNKLSTLQVEKLVKNTTKPTWFGDGLGLYLMVRRKGDASWTFVYKISGRRSFLGLGPLHTVSLAEARARAADARKLILDGKDPLAVRRDVKAAATVEQLRTWTFEQAALEFLKTDKIEGLKNGKHKAQWLSTLRTYAFPIFGNLPLQQIDSAIVLKALLAAWKRTPETGSRLRGRIERVFGWAKPLGLYVGENPASRDVLKDHLPKKQKVTHHKALPYSDLPAFMAKLMERESVSARALEFTILTACRTGEVIGARWAEIDLKAATWTIPGDRMKAGKEHIVPLSGRAVAILKAMPRTGEHVFINGGGKAISNAAMSELLKGMRARCTVHGFRSTFSDWAHDRTGFTPDVIEHCLAHVVKNKVAAAYRRETALAKRVMLMGKWAEYCESQGVAGDNVVAIRA